MPKLAVVASDSSGDADAATDTGAESLALDQASSNIGDRLLLDAWIGYRDRDALAHLINRYRNMVLSVCRRQSRTREDAEDAFQVTFLTLVRDAERLRKRGCLAGWLHQVAYRTACRTRKLNRATEHLPVDPPDDSTNGQKSLQTIAHRHRLRALDEEIEQLPKKYRDAIVLHYFDGLTYEQTATILGSSEPAIRGRLGRARARLQRQLSRRGFAFSTVLGSIASLSADQAVASDHVAVDLANQAVTRCVKSSMGQSSSPNLESLLNKETPMLFSTTSLATIGAVACTAVGLMFAPLGETLPGGRDQTSVQLPGVASSVSAVEVTAAEVVTPAFAAEVPQAADVSSDPFAESDGDSSDDPFADPPFRTAPSKQAVADPFGAARPSALPANVTREDSTTGQSSQDTNVKWASGNVDFHKRVEQALSKQVGFSFIELPLSDAIEQISERSGLPVQIDKRALDDLGVSTDDQVNLEVRNISLESALNLIVSSLDLTYTVDNEIVTITSVECDEDKHQLLRIYWAGEVGLQATPGSVRLIQSLVTPDTWDTLGGVSTISILTAEKSTNSALGIRTSYTTHRKIERFLQSIKAGSNEPMQGAPIETGKSSDRSTNEGGVF
ncbi:ECF RNA polymerase sigma factor SigE [Rubripirellula obstinata]|uniref:ECF RNA polymerase sigma factor SigE n=1 Tax=Rubripirellula obstinata TaxID=406547 RepID=A0A5B1CR24_9BACT|nr:sigma-70 family RNA polymerase sigma factor [Rubripirellula obstinata]KAA1261833.1 ECF RNA polymerase sigma factor SigE [Rubripirellula obstinata]